MPARDFERPNSCRKCGSSGVSAANSIVSTSTSAAARTRRWRIEGTLSTLGGVTIRVGGAVQQGVNAASPPLEAPVAARSGFAEIAAEQLDAVYAYVVYLTGDRSAAEDIAAETFEKAFRTWRRFDPRRGSPRTWLCAIARSLA